MTEQEFQTEYDKLKSVYADFRNTFKEMAVAKAVKDMDAKWWRALVNRIILSSNPRLDIDDAARGERLAKKRAEDTKILLEASSVASENGLSDVLNRMGAGSLMEAVQKSKKQISEGDK